MNLLSIDFGTKRIGLAIAQDGIISTLPAIKNDQSVFGKIQKICDEYQVGKIYVGLSMGQIGEYTKGFVTKLSSVLELPIETIEEQVSTIEAKEIYIENKKKKKNFEKSIDSYSAAVILRRVIG